VTTTPAIDPFSSGGDAVPAVIPSIIRPPDPSRPDIKVAWVEYATRTRVALSVDGVPFELPAEDFPPVPESSPGGYYRSSLMPGDAVVVAKTDEMVAGGGILIAGPQRFSRSHARSSLTLEKITQSIYSNSAISGLVTRVTPQIIIIDLVYFFAILTAVQTQMVAHPGSGILASTNSGATLRPGQFIRVYVTSVSDDFVLVNLEPAPPVMSPSTGTIGRYRYQQPPMPSAPRDLLYSRTIPEPNFERIASLLVSETEANDDSHRFEQAGPIREPSFEQRIASLLVSTTETDNDFRRFEQADRLSSLFQSANDLKENLPDLAFKEALHQPSDRDRLYALQVLSIACDRAGERSYLPRLQLEAADVAVRLGRTTQAQSHYLAALRSAADTGDRSVAVKAMAALQPYYPDLLSPFSVGLTARSTE
jgi:hypothetical protein